MYKEKKVSKYILKYNEIIYCNVGFEEIVEILLNDEEKKYPMTNRLLLIEMLKVICILKNKRLNIISSKEYVLEYIFDYNLIINDDESIINIINDLKFAEIIKR
ncbi:TPA: hypothetical protein I9148_002911 [Clostridium perfringens]|nr:hypothetical protein [Clostridium perfringens]